MSSNETRRTAYRLAILSFVLVPWSAAAQDACANMEQPLTDALKQEYAALAVDALEEKGTPDQFEVDTVLQSGSWSVAYVTPPDEEPGYLFFEDVAGQKQFKDVWGGIATTSERPDVARWAEELGAPEDLATCFANIAADIED